MLALLVVAELALRSFIVVGRSAVPAMLANSLDGNAPLTSDAWGYRFLRNHAEGRALVEQPLYRLHPTRGWTTNPNAAVWVEENLYTTNEYGQRGPSTPAKQTTKTKVMVLGDSQTFGEEVDDSFTWPSILARARPDLEIVNLAVSGYGVDQMYVTFREELDVWKPDVVVLSPMRDDFYRASLWFRDYSKPWFEPRPAADGAIELDEHPPIAEVDAALGMLDGMPGVRLRASRLVNLFLAVHDTVRVVPAEAGAGRRSSRRSSCAACATNAARGTCRSSSRSSATSAAPGTRTTRTIPASASFARPALRSRDRASRARTGATSRCAPGSRGRGTTSGSATR